MYKSTLTALALLGVASAANSTTSLWLVGFEQENIVGSVIASDATATTYSLGCSDSENCALPTPFILTQGPSTIHYSYTGDVVSGVTDAATETVNLGCAVTASASGVCSITIAVDVVSVYSSTTSSTTTFTDAADLGLTAVTITAGAGSRVSNGTTTATATASTSSGTDTLAKVTANGNMPVITQAPWALGAVAAGMAFAAM